MLGQLAHTGPVTLLATRLERQQCQVVGKAVQDCVRRTFFICIDLSVIVDGLPCVMHGEPSAACGKFGQRPMQNQSARVQSAKPQEPRPRRRVAASFNRRLEVLRRYSHETTEGLPPYQREWAGKVAVGEGPEASLLGEPTWAEGVNRDSGNRQRSKAEAQPGPGFYRSATFPQGLTAVVRAGGVRKATPWVTCDSHTLPSAAAPALSIPESKASQAR